MKSVDVEASRSRRVDVQLHPGGVQESVEVVAGSPLVDSTRNVQGDTIGGEQAAEIPLNGRDFTKLLSLVPGTAGGPERDQRLAGLVRPLQHQRQPRPLEQLPARRHRHERRLPQPAGDQRGRRVRHAGHGAADRRRRRVPDPLRRRGRVRPQRRRASSTSSRSPARTLAGDGVSSTSATRRSGARNYFNRSPRRRTSSATTSSAARSAGRSRRTRRSTSWPTRASANTAGCRVRRACPPTPSSQDAIAANGGVVNPVIAGLLRRQSLARAEPGARRERQQPDRRPRCSTTASTASSPRSTSTSAPVDLLTVRYFFGDSDQSFPLGLLGGGFLPGYNTVTPTNVQLLSASFTHVLSPKLLLEVRGGYNRFDEDFFPEDRDFDPNSIGLATVSEPAGLRPAADQGLGIRERRRQPLAAARPRRQQLPGLRELSYNAGPAQLEGAATSSAARRGRVLRCRLPRAARLRQPRRLRGRADSPGGRQAQGRLAAASRSRTTTPSTFRTHSRRAAASRSTGACAGTTTA